MSFFSPHVQIILSSWTHSTLTKHLNLRSNVEWNTATVGVNPCVCVSQMVNCVCVRARLSSCCSAYNLWPDLQQKTWDSGCSGHGWEQGFLCPSVCGAPVAWVVLAQVLAFTQNIQQCKALVSLKLEECTVFLYPISLEVRAIYTTTQLWQVKL